MTINEARKVARLVRMAAEVHGISWNRGIVERGLCAVLSESFPDFDWEINRGEIQPFERAVKSAGPGRPELQTFATMGAALDNLSAARENAERES